jgi:uncharacterized protein
VNPADAIAILGLTAFAATVQATAGFGFSLVLVPLLVVVIGPKETVVVANILSTALEAALLVRVHQYVDWRLGTKLFTGALVGMPFGLIALIWLSPKALQIVIAVTVVVFTLLLMRGVRLHRAGPLGDLFAGVVSGVLNTSTSMSGPPVVIYLQGRGVARAAFRATLLAYFAAISLIAVGLLAASNQFDKETGVAALVAIPALAVGGLLGNFLHHRVPEQRFRQLVYAILFFSAGSAIVSALTR